MKNKKTLVLLSLALFLSAGAVYGSLRYDSSREQEELMNNPQSDNIVENKDQTLTDGEKPPEDKVIDPTAPAYDTESSALEKPNVTRAEMSGDFIRVSATFTKASSGECVAIFEKDGAQTVTKTASIIVGPSYYTCNGFRVARSEFSKSGQWTVTLLHRSNGIEAASEKRVLEVI